MLADIWAVAWFEYRRHLRSRLFWRRLLGGALLALLLTVLLSWALYSLTQIGSPLRSYAIMLQLMLSLQGLVGLIAPLFMTPQVFSDKTRRGETPDIYMTALHPLAIVLGRLLAVGLQTGLTLLVLFPAGVFICQLAGFPMLYWVQVLGMTWLAALMWASLAARWLNKYLPGKLTAQSVETMSQSPLLTLLLFVPLMLFIPISPLLGLELSMPLLMMIPPLIPEEILREYTIGSWAIPAWVMATPFTLGFTLLSAVATAQWLGWWSDTVYRWQRWLGTLFYWLFCGVNLAVIAGVWAHSAVRAEQTVFVGMIASVAVYLLVVSPLLGYYGVGIRPRHGRYALPPPLGGLVWEWAMVFGIACAAWLGVGISGGYWVASLRWLAWGVCLWSLFVLIQSVQGVSRLKYLFLRDGSESLGRGFGWRNTAERRVELGGGSYEGWLLPAVVLPFVFLSLQRTRLPQDSLLVWLVKVAVWLLPFNGLSHFRHPLWHYWLYAAYSLGITAAVFLFRYQQLKRWDMGTEQSIKP